MLLHPDVFVVENDTFERRKIAEWIDSAGLRAHTYRDTREFLTSEEQTSAGAIVIDMSQPGEIPVRSNRSSRSFRASGMTLPVIALAERGDVSAAVRAMRAGAIDVIEKPVDPRALIERIQSCLDGAEGRAIEPPEGSQLAVAPLTRRERQVLDLVATGRTSKAIGFDLGISQKTVEKHRKHIMQKLHAGSLAELLRIYWTA